MYNQHKKRPAKIVLLPEEKTASNILHPSMETFDWKGKCMFSCGPYQKYIRHPNRNNCHEVTTSHLKEQVLLSCQKRNDQISKEVTLRVRLCNDLGTMEAHYHTSSKITFMNPRKRLILEKKMQRSLLGSQLRMKSCCILIGYVSGLNRKQSVIQWKSYIKEWLKWQILQLFTQQNG